MSTSTMQSDKVVNHAVKSIISNLDFQLFARQTLKKIPEHTSKSISRLNSNIILMDNIPRPNYKYQRIIEEDPMPQVPAQEARLTGKVSWQAKSQLQLKTASSSLNRRKFFSRYASTSDRKELKDNIHLDLSQLKENKVIQIVNRSQQSTAKTFRSVIQLDSQIAELRKKYLKDLRREAQLKFSMTQQNFNVKKKRIPKEFTFDFSGEILEKRNSSTKRTLFSPLKYVLFPSRSKSVSAQKVQKKVKELRENYEQDSSLQQRLQRSKTGSSQRKIREFNNLNQRQTSHIPFISLAQNSKLYQNCTKMQVESKTQNMESTVYSRKSSFMYYSEKNRMSNNQDLQKGGERFPKNFHKLNRSAIGEGRIVKNKDLNGEKRDFEFVQVQITSYANEKRINSKRVLNY